MTLQYHKIAFKQRFEYDIKALGKGDIYAQSAGHTNIRK